MRPKGVGPDGRPGYVSPLTPDGARISPARDTYDHAFVLPALATVYQFDRDAQVRAEIDALLGFLDSQLKSEHGGYREGLPATLPRRQNPQMHLFEAMIALFDATHDMAFQNRAGDFFALLQRWTDKYRYGSVTTEDFMALAATHSSKPLKDLWDDWLFTPELPPFPGPS